jgi:hypothetical protein
MANECAEAYREYLCFTIFSVRFTRDFVCGYNGLANLVAQKSRYVMAFCETCVMGLHLMGAVLLYVREC